MSETPDFYATVRATIRDFRCQNLRYADESDHMALADVLAQMMGDDDIERATEELDQLASNIADDTAPELARLREVNAELLAVIRDFRQKLATYAGIYPGDKELRRQLADCDTAIAKAEPLTTSPPAATAERD